jgi:hypothetical protein
VLTDAKACASFHVLLVDADEQRAMTVGLGPEQVQRISGPTEFDLADLDVSLLAGSHLSQALCTDLPGNVQVDNTEDVDDGTLTITIEGGRADFVLRGCHLGHEHDRGRRVRGRAGGTEPGLVPRQSRGSCRCRASSEHSGRNGTPDRPGRSPARTRPGACDSRSGRVCRGRRRR